MTTAVATAMLILSASLGTAAPAHGFGIEPGSFTTAATERNGTVDSQAGSHPFEYTVDFKIKLLRNKGGRLVPEGEPRDVIVNLPAGLSGNPRAVPQCPAQDLVGLFPNCPGNTQIGLVDTVFGGVIGDEALFNLTPPAGLPARFGFTVNGLSVYLDPSVRTGSDYGDTVTSNHIPSGLEITSVHAIVWGVPADKGHDAERHCREPGGKIIVGCSVEEVPKPFLTLPVSCNGPLSTTLTADPYEEPGIFIAPLTAESAGLTGCERIDFRPSIEAQPDTHTASAPAGLQFDLHLPQTEEPEGLASAELKNAVVTLPEGMTVNPSAANSLQACPLLHGREKEKEEREQRGELSGINLESAKPADCPAASKIGNVEVFTPLLEHPLPGSVYLAAQEQNPFGSLLAIYLAIDDPATGVDVKLAGHVEAGGEPGGGAGLAPGQLRTTFTNNPQQPLEDFKLEFFGGPRAALVNPPTCGTQTVTSDLTPWSSPEAPDATPSSNFLLDEGCASPGFDPSFAAGTTNAQGGAYSPFLLTLSRGDGEQELRGLEQTLPPGLLAKLAGVPLCPSAAAATGSCPASSQIGTVTVAAGVGPDPVYVPGTIYLTGPYNGGPFGEVVEVPAIAGPFDLDENGRPVVVRGSIRIDPSTAQATVVSDPFPTILRGIPVRVRTVSVTLDRSGFTFNASSCAPEAVTATISSTTGASVPVSSPYEAANCAALPFAPGFSASTDGHTSKQDGASLHVRVTSGGVGQANIRKVELTIPSVLPSRLTTLQKACTEAQFNANPAGCPPASDIATAIVHTPLLQSPLSGPVYFVSHGGAAFPDTEIILQGEGVTLVLDGHTDIKHGVTYSRFQTVPDAPFTSFEFNAPEGPYSVLAANANLCQTEVRMPTTITAQNGAVLTQDTLVAPEGCPNTLTILSHTVHKRTLTLTVAVPGPGKLTATGKGLTKTAKTATARATLALTLTAPGHRELKTHVKLTFVPSKGKKLTATTSAKFKA